MIKKILKIAGMATPFVMHFIIMSVILILVLVNIKYGLEFDLIGTEYGHLVNSVYNIVYFLFLISYFLFLISYFLFLISYFLFLISYFLFGSVISFAAFYFTYLLIVRWIETK
ncbi:hypothetical protein BHR42_23185 [Aeromonas salmonicida subsp. salmonicida]|nr:hypothetical protein BHR42_23185 [Aeromonas salmonicida subsp. salmonicida]